MKGAVARVADTQVEGWGLEVASLEEMAQYGGMSRVLESFLRTRPHGHGLVFSVACLAGGSQSLGRVRKAALGACETG